jgi:serine/threonine protein phosphatase 1
MRTLAIGDIHGCAVALDALLGMVRPEPADRLIALGDYVDRGPDSAGVLDRMVALFDAGRLVALRGNHDEMMLNARRGEDVRMWLTCGGRATLISYGAPFPDIDELKRVSERHWRFLEQDCVGYYETENHFFVHASVHPEVPLDEQPGYMLYWEKLFEPVAHCSGKVMVCGHTKQNEGRPLNLGTTVCIDTGVYDSEGWLTCLHVERGFYWQANQRGATRTGWLEEPEE